MEIKQEVLDALPALEAQAQSDGIEKYVVGSIVTLRGKLLVVFRSSYDDFLPGNAELPGGGVDPGETILEALERETLEETGLPIRMVEGYVGFFDYTSGSGRKTRQFNFWITPEHDQVVLVTPEGHEHPEHDRYEWVDLDRLEVIERMQMSQETKNSIYAATNIISS